MEVEKTRKKKKTDLQVYHLKETDKFLNLIERLDYTRKDKTRIVNIIEYKILYNGKVTITRESMKYDSSNQVVWKDYKILDKFTIPVRRFKELKKWVRKGLPYQIVTGPLISSDMCYFKRYNDECFTRCIIKWYTGFRNCPIKKVVNDYELTYPYILSFIRPYTKLEKLHMSNLSIVRENII